MASRKARQCYVDPTVYCTETREHASQCIHQAHHSFPDVPLEEERPGTVPTAPEAPGAIPAAPEAPSAPELGALFLASAPTAPTKKCAAGEVFRFGKCLPTQRAGAAVGGPAAASTATQAERYSITPAAIEAQRSRAAERAKAQAEFLRQAAQCPSDKPIYITSASGNACVKCAEGEIADRAKNICRTATPLERQQVQLASVLSARRKALSGSFIV